MPDKSTTVQRPIARQRKPLPDGLRRQVEAFSASLKKTWAELESEAGQERGHKGIASAKEADLGEFYDGELDFMPAAVISFAQLDQAKAAQEVAESMRERVEQFQEMINNIFLWSSPEIVPDKISAASDLFNEFIAVVGAVLLGQDDGELSMPAGEAQPSESMQLSESYAPMATLVEVDNTSLRSPLEMDVQLIQPGWGNSRDNHYYPAEMLKRDAHVFEGVKMYVTDHRADEKSERTEVSQIKRIVGFTETGAPIGRVIVFDPVFAEKCRNRAKAGILESLECSILADGKARPGFELGGRKGKVVEAITGASSVDWVTRAGAGGKAISLAETAQGLQEDKTNMKKKEEDETTPVQESESAATVTIREQDEAETVPGTAPVVEAPPVAEVEPEAVVTMLGEVEIKEALAKVNLPASSIVSLAFGKYETSEALQSAISAEVKQVKETTGSGRPFGLGMAGETKTVAPRATAAEVDATIDKINHKFLG